MNYNSAYHSELHDTDNVSHTALTVTREGGFTTCAVVRNDSPKRIARGAGRVRDRLCYCVN